MVIVDTAGVHLFLNSPRSHTHCQSGLIACVTKEESRAYRRVRTFLPVNASMRKIGLSVVGRRMYLPSLLNLIPDHWSAV
jgi:hypothetical protein